MSYLATVALAVYSFLLVQTNIHRLPARIPTHFNAVGEADGWGSPDTLWILPVLQALTCGLFLLTPILGRRFPGTVHVGWRRLSDFTAEQQGRVLSLLTDMMGYSSVLLGLLFAFLLRQIIHAAFSPHPHLSVGWPLGLFLGGTAAVVVYYLRRMMAVVNEVSSGRRSVT